MIIENTTKLDIPESGKISRKLGVFYNPLMKFNRDISVLLINALGQDLRAADPLAGSGVRAIRFLKECKNVKEVYANDVSKEAVENMTKNAKLNDVKFSISNMDANRFLLESTGFDYIDVDPFGSPNPFLQSAIIRLSRESILAVTATDTAPLSGTYPEACLRKYWAKPMNNYLMHEVGLRILIRKVQLVGAEMEKALVPIFSYSKDHYFRIFFRCEKHKSAVDKVLEQHGYLVHCDSCLDRWVSKDIFSKKCKKNHKIDYAGPLWLGNLWDEKLAERMLKLNKDKETAEFLKIILEESKIQVVGFYDMHAAAKAYKKNSSPMSEVIEKLKKNKVSRTHFNPHSIRSDINLKNFLRVV